MITSTSATTSSDNQTDGSQLLTGSSSLGKDDFLKLLVTELQHQDPTSPMDDSQFMAQMAQFSTLEQITNVATSITQLGTSEKVSQGVALIGHSIAYTKDDGSTGTGNVTGVSIVGGEIRVEMGNDSTTPDSITSIGPAVNTGGGSTSSDGSSSGA
jgi:flagellar basal-body rod modification protein FlgD